MKNKYPIYIISKGRPNSCLTAKQLKLMGVDFSLVIEPQEYEAYKHVTDNIIVLPFSNLGQGSIPARNFVWEHSKELGHSKHWILDDNIEALYRLNRNQKSRLLSPVFFRCMEDFTDRYKNIAISGANYESFCKKTDYLPPYYLNTRVYSCLLIDNSIPYRWRGRYNEDTDLCLRVLKDKLCTVLFNAFLIGKVTTMRMKGGNTDNVYTDNDDRLKFAKALQELHPDVVKVVWKFNRWHHRVNYKNFKHKLIFKDNIEIPNKINEYGMRLTDNGN